MWCAFCSGRFARLPTVLISELLFFADPFTLARLRETSRDFSIHLYSLEFQRRYLKAIVHVPISPNPAIFGMARLLARWTAIFLFHFRILKAELAFVDQTTQAPQDTIWLPTCLQLRCPYCFTVRKPLPCQLFHQGDAKDMLKNSAKELDAECLRRGVSYSGESKPKKIERILQHITESSFTPWLASPEDLPHGYSRMPNSKPRYHCPQCAKNRFIHAGIAVRLFGFPCPHHFIGGQGCPHGCSANSDARFWTSYRLPNVPNVTFHVGHRYLIEDVVLVANHHKWMNKIRPPLLLTPELFKYYQRAPENWRRKFQIVLAAHGSADDSHMKQQAKDFMIGASGSTRFKIECDAFLYPAPPPSPLRPALQTQQASQLPPQPAQAPILPKRKAVTIPPPVLHTTSAFVKMLDHATLIEPANDRHFV